MKEKDFGHVLVDVCDGGCKGLWFDWLELGKLDHSNQGFGQSLEEALQNPRQPDSNRKNLTCAKCQTSMHRHDYRSNKELVVDECYKCGGFFLDSGELKCIRDLESQKVNQEKLTNELKNHRKIYHSESSSANLISRIRRFQFDDLPTALIFALAIILYFILPATIWGLPSKFALTLSVLIALSMVGLIIYKIRNR